jgi:hypothetical protein
MDRSKEIKITKKDLLQNNEQLFSNIDKTILDYFNNELDLHVIENNNKVKVPIILSTPER